MPARILASDQERQLERVGEAADLLRRRLGDHQVLALESSAEDSSGVALGGRGSLLSGAETVWRV
jgi:hypothetical protein